MKICSRQFRMMLCGVMASSAMCIVVRVSPADRSAAPAWNAAAAARYLDSREVWWQGWDRAQKDHGTLCVSCHTQASYALARPAIRRRLGEHGLSQQEQTMLTSIEKRVRGWNDMKPFYSDAVYGTGKEIESRNAESVLNAIILASYDAGAKGLSERARIAFDNAWALQSKTGPDAGAWVWQNFDYAPWESKESQYHWAAMMAVAVGKAPGRYRDNPAIAENRRLLTDYLRSHYDEQPILNKIVAVWASIWFPDVVTKDKRQALFDLVYTLQKEGGGWSLSALGGWKRRDGSPLEFRSDGYATGLVVLVLEETGADESMNDRAVLDRHVRRGIAWLDANQNMTTGAWPAWSLNKNRDVATPVGQFMGDAATSYAVLALEKAQK